MRVSFRTTRACTSTKIVFRSAMSCVIVSRILAISPRTRNHLTFVTFCVRVQFRS
jgi:hypothetical protein